MGRKPIINLSFLACAVSLADGGRVARFVGVCGGDVLCVVARLSRVRLHHRLCVHAGTVPTSIRAMGCGVGGAWLKVAAIFAPAIVSKTMIGGNLQIAFYILRGRAVSCGGGGAFSRD